MKFDLEITGAFAQIEAETEKEAKRILYKKLEKVLDQFVILGEQQQEELKERIVIK